MFKSAFLMPGNTGNAKVPGNKALAATEAAAIASAEAFATAADVTNLAAAEAYTNTQVTLVEQLLGCMQCGRLTYSSATALQYLPYNGNILRIDGAPVQIPSSGIAGLGNTSIALNGVLGQNLAASTTYWVYAFMLSGVVTAMFFDAAHGGNVHGPSSTAGNVGTEILTGNDLISLIGMCWTNASAQFADIATVSWFNRRTKSSQTNAAGSANTTTAGSTNFVTWADDSVFSGFVGDVQMATANAEATSTILLDGSAAVASTTNTTPVANGIMGAVSFFNSGSLTEGQHTIAGDISVNSGTFGYSITVQITIRG